ncbi:MAG: histidine--tRNA ligase [Bacteroidota bacterium]
MSKQKPSLARGTRDFGPEKMAKRNYIFSTIKSVFQKFGFEPLETPAIENLSVLMGKYGEEGDQLLFKILNSGNFSEKLAQVDLDEGYKNLTMKVSEKGLRYDLTVPFARFVAMNRNDLVFPFKRYQIQPVWRADRPQRGRYREFYQCDADVVGTNSLICEAEIIAILQEILTNLGIDFIVKINNRKILTGISEAIGAAGQESTLAIAIDKLDKIGKEAVLLELKERGFSDESLQKIEPIFSLSGSDVEKLDFLKTFLKNSQTGQIGVEELEKVLELSKAYGAENEKVEIDITLARGLSYYTGAIFEVKANGVQMGSISGGGRYDNLTDLFGLPGVSGVGISLGVDRIYDVLDELNLYPDFAAEGTKVVISNFDKILLPKILPILAELRMNNIKSEIYPDSTKLGKQIEYASKKKIPYFLIIGEEEIENQLFSMKNLITGEQVKMSFDEILVELK